jgi:hypothetical protein
MNQIHQPGDNGKKADRPQHDSPRTNLGRPACPACGGPLIEIKQKLQCANCRTICETCCEGGRG